MFIFLLSGELTEHRVSKSPTIDRLTILGLSIKTIKKQRNRLANVVVDLQDSTQIRIVRQRDEGRLFLGGDHRENLADERWFVA